MESLVSFGRPKTTGLVGSVISLALVFGGSAAFADDGLVEGFVMPGYGGVFSPADLDQLDQANSAEATASRLAAMTDATIAVTAVRSRTTAPVTAVRGRTTAPVDVVATVDAEPFPISGRLVPMLVTNPRVEVAALQAGVTLRPGLVQPVGVPRHFLRSPTPSERAAR